MKKQKHNLKRFVAWTAVCCAALAAFPNSVFAAEETTETSISETETAVTETTSTDTANVMSTEDYIEEYLANQTADESSSYSSADYDTDGNATLIENQNIIYDSDEMQFISVTTKDGNVFYVLINYSDEDEVDNVYFLNKVDDYDLYALLYADNEESAYSSAEEAAAANASASSSADTSADANESSEDVEDGETDEEAEETTETVTENDGGTSGSMTLYLCIGVVVIAGVGFFFWKKKGGSFGKKSASQSDVIDHFADDDDDFEIEEEEE